MKRGSKKDKVVYRGSFLSIVHRGHYEFAHRHRARSVVAIVPITEKNEIVLVEQLRLPIQKAIIELPAGLVGDQDAKESTRSAADRELVEETGFKASRLKRIGLWPTSAGMTSEAVEIYLATGLKKIGHGGGVDDENIKVHVVPIKNVLKWLDKQRRAGRFTDPKILAGLYLWENEYKKKNRNH